MEGGGTHGGLHHREFLIVMSVQGTLFKAELEFVHPAAIIDIALTILYLLGIRQPRSMDGRVIAEALADLNDEPHGADTVVHSVERDRVVQHLKYTRVGSTTYLDAGWVE